MKLRVLRHDELERLLPMKEAIQRMRGAFAELAAGRAVMPMRSRVDTEHGDLLIMPACLPDAGLCLKAVLTYPENRQRDLPVVVGAVLLFDAETGMPRALMDCELLTALRTGATGGLAIELLARRTSHVLGVIGAGVQARRQIEAAQAVRDISRIILFDPRPGAAPALRDAIVADGQPATIAVADTARDVVRQADIVITATTSPVPTFDGRDLRPGTHVNAIGSYRPETRELDAYTVQHAYVVADSREACMKEAGDLIIPGREPDAELAEIVACAGAGRTDDEQITVFKSVGLAIQDAAVAGWALSQAEKRQIGLVVDF